MVSGHCHLCAVLGLTGCSCQKGRGYFGSSRDPQSPEPLSEARHCPSAPHVRGHPQGSPCPVSPSPAAAVPRHLGAGSGVRGPGWGNGNQLGGAGGDPGDGCEHTTGPVPVETPAGTPAWSPLRPLLPGVPGIRDMPGVRGCRCREYRE